MFTCLTVEYFGTQRLHVCVFACNVVQFMCHTHNIRHTQLLHRSIHTTLPKSQCAPAENVPEYSHILARQQRHI